MTSLSDLQRENAVNEDLIAEVQRKMDDLQQEKDRLQGRRVALYQQIAKLEGTLGLPDNVSDVELIIATARKWTDNPLSVPQDVPVTTRLEDDIQYQQYSGYLESAAIHLFPKRRYDLLYRIGSPPVPFLVSKVDYDH